MFTETVEAAPLPLEVGVTLDAEKVIWFAGSVAGARLQVLKDAGSHDRPTAVPVAPHRVLLALVVDT